jgi:PKD repeat protein
MKKLLLILAIGGTFVFTAEAQRPRCFTTEYSREESLKNPQYDQNRADLERFTEQYTSQQNVNRTSSVVLPYIIPVVFHVLHDYGPENLPDYVLIEAVRLMNEDYRKLNPDTVDIIPPFKQIAADCEIEFRLAQIDPQGNCTNGIEHIPTLKTYLANDLSKLNPWPNNKYLNIWVANTLENPTAAAYSVYPGAAASRDGIMCWYLYADNTSTTLTHEAGHSLNLWHVWGDTNDPNVACGDDNVSDTPITQGWTQCNLSGSVCNPPIIENVQNYMDYSYCSNMFTQGQKVRMTAALNSSIGGRNNLWTPANLAATGTDGSPATLCIPKADFKVEYKGACVGDSVLFTDQSWKGKVASWSWSFPGGNPSASTDSNPKVVYPVAGIYAASLRVANASGADSITKTSVIHITGPALTTVPYMQSFEDTSSFPGVDGWVENPDNSSTWSRVVNAASAGTCSIKANNYINTAGSVDDWITPSLDFSNVNSPVTISFKVANAQRSSTSNDELKLYYSLNCGKSWTSTSYSKGGPALSTAGVVTSNFTPNPAIPTQWRQESIFVNPVKLKPNVRFKFENISDHGNNTYIDEINMTGNIVSVDEVEDIQTGFTMFPNPTKGTTNVDFLLAKSSTVRLEVKDIIGRTVSVEINETMPSGMHEYKLPVLSPGIYIVDLTVNNKHHARKLVVS